MVPSQLTRGRKNFDISQDISSRSPHRMAAENNTEKDVPRHQPPFLPFADFGIVFSSQHLQFGDFCEETPWRASSLDKLKDLHVH